MRLSNDLIKSLQAHLKELYDLDYTDEQTQDAGVAIMRFVIAKVQREQELLNEKENSNE